MSRGQAFHFPDLETGVDAIRRVLRDGFRPPVVRLCDEKESGWNFVGHCPEGRCFLILLHEGPEELVAAQLGGVAHRCGELGGEPASAEAVDHWLTRNRVPGFGGFLEQGIVLDTIEVAATWDRIVPLYRAAVASLQEVEGLPNASAHTSHSYRSGTNLYLTFLARPRSAGRWKPPTTSAGGACSTRRSAPAAGSPTTTGSAASAPRASSTRSGRRAWTSCAPSSELSIPATSSTPGRSCRRRRAERWRAACCSRST